MRKFLLGTSLIISMNSANAITIEEALTSGYQNDEELQVIRTQFLNEIEQFPKAVAEFMPRIRAEFDNQNQQVKRKSGLRGTDNITRKSNNFSKTITLEQPLFKGGSGVAGIKAAQASFRASRASFYVKEQKALLEQINNYLTCVEAMDKYHISKISVKSNRTQLEAMKEKFRLGESTETEVASAEAGLANAEANQSISYSNYEAAKANFNRVFGLEPSAIAMPKIPTDLPKTLDELVDRALKVNLEIDSAKNTSLASKANETAAKGVLLPQVSLKVQNGRDAFNPQNSDNGDINRSSLTSTLSINVPILAKGGAEYSDIRRAKYQTRLSAVNLESQIKSVKATCKASWEAFLASKQRIEATEKGISAAEIAYDGMIQEEMLGSKTIVDVLNFEEKLNKARESRVEAFKDHVFAAYKIKSLVGEITAKSMKLPVTYFEPEDEFKSIKRKIIGF